mmetsp:Transcript_17318/g.36152  ORF Transcript_17318/g.36152 Transcript_17318/m.36152 type:complete len:259 (-) Transcript_17318:315-1091(-)
MAGRAHAVVYGDPRRPPCLQPRSNEPDHAPQWDLRGLEHRHCSIPPWRAASALGRRARHNTDRSRSSAHLRGGRAPGPRVQHADDVGAPHRAHHRQLPPGHAGTGAPVHCLHAPLPQADRGGGTGARGQAEGAGDAAAGRHRGSVRCVLQHRPQGAGRHAAHGLQGLLDGNGPHFLLGDGVGLRSTGPAELCEQRPQAVPADRLPANLQVTLDCVKHCCRLGVLRGVQTAYCQSNVVCSLLVRSREHYSGHWPLQIPS